MIEEVKVVNRIENLRQRLLCSRVGDRWVLTTGKEVELTLITPVFVRGKFEVLGVPIERKWWIGGWSAGMYPSLACPADYLVRRDGTRLETPSAPEKARIAQNLIDAGYLTPDQMVGILEHPIAAPAVLCVGPHAPVDTGMRRSWCASCGCGMEFVDMNWVARGAE